MLHKTIRELIDFVFHQGESSDLLNCTTTQLIARNPNFESLDIDVTDKKAYNAFQNFGPASKATINASNEIPKELTCGACWAQINAI